MCDCISYNQPERDQTVFSVILNPNEYFQWDSKARPVSIDACIADGIKRLWSAGVWTLGSCCGHNAKAPSVGLDNPKDADKAREILGPSWKILAWVLTPLAEPAVASASQCSKCLQKVMNP